MKKLFWGEKEKLEEKKLREENGNYFRTPRSSALMFETDPPVTGIEIQKLLISFLRANLKARPQPQCGRGWIIQLTAPPRRRHFRPTPATRS